MPKKVKKYPEKSDTVSVVNEPFALYLSSSKTLDFMNAFISGFTTPIYKLTSFEKMKLLDTGINKEALEQFKAKVQLDYDKLAKALSVTRATLINKKKNEIYSENVSEKIVALTDLYSYGYEVFEDVEKFNSWMFVPNQSLGGIKPFEIVDNQFGREEIKNLLGRIEYGIYS